MNKEEILNDDFVEKEIIQPKSHKKLKIAIAIVASLAIIATTTLLVGYFKFDWFKENYNIDAKISRNLYQANYFTETKTIKTKVGFTSGESKETEQILYTNFMVLQSDRKEFENNDFLNTATLVILDTKFNQNNELKEITNFDIFDQNKINEFMANPDATKYPMSIFSFYDNGKIADIKLPNNMDESNAHHILELIENIIPKLSRNKVEDISNGIKINTINDNKKRTLVESISPRELPDFKGSKFVKSIERDIEKDEITNIRTRANLDLITELEEGESGFGLQDYKYETKSNIVATGKTQEKKDADLVEKLTKYYTFIKSQDLLEKLNKDHKEIVLERWEEKDINSPDSKLRNLASFSSFNYDKTFDVKKITILGCSFQIKVRIGVKSGKAFGEVIIQANNGKVSFGTNGITGSYSKSWSGEYTVFSFQFPPMPAVGINLKAGGSGSVSASLSGSTLTVSVSGTLYAKAQITAGWDQFISVSVGAKGTIVKASLSGAITTGGSISKKGTLSAGQVLVYVDGKLLNHSVYYKEWTVFNGWTSSF